MNRWRLILMAAVVLFIGFILAPMNVALGEAIIAEHSCISEFESIPGPVITSISSSYEILYLHTSHGSQIMTGISLVEAENPLYNPPVFVEPGDDLGAAGDTSWVPATRTYLESPSYDFNMAMFSWCGGVSDNTEEGINIYLAKMEELEADYPDVIFIYMTGHLDGTGPAGNLYIRNNQIRDYCALHDKILFDFADIESYDPDGVYYPDDSDACEWCYDWCAAHVCPDCSCAHSQCFNCYQKGKAWWWMMARISGWNSDPDDVPDIVAISPLQNQLDVTTGSNITVTFDTDMNEATISSSTVVAHGSLSGKIQGSVSYESLSRTVVLDPDQVFEFGEIVTVTVTEALQSSTGEPLEESFVWSFTAKVGGGHGKFGSIASYPAGDIPGGPCISDFDGNGHLDIAVPSKLNDSAYIYLNAGDADFSTIQIYEVGHYPGAVEAGDFDGDGFTDLAVSNRASEDISILLNSGDGTLTEGYLISLISDPSAVCAADFDGDGDLDIAVPHWEIDSVSILAGDGHGMFSLSQTLRTGDNPKFATAGDIDNDGDLDMAVANFYDYSISIYRNAGDGTFAWEADYPLDGGPRDVSLVDVDADRDLDIVAPSQSSMVMSVLLNIGDGTFAAQSTYWAGGTPYSTAVADYDGDSDLDMAVACLENSVVSALFNNGLGSFYSMRAFPVDKSPSYVAYGDLDGDGDLDLVTANVADDDISILLNYECGDADRSGGVDIDDAVYLINYIFAGGPPPEPLESGDVDCSGAPDIDDVVYMIAYIFSGGNPPCDPDGDGMDEC